MEFPYLGKLPYPSLDRAFPGSLGFRLAAVWDSEFRTLGRYVQTSETVQMIVILAEIWVCFLDSSVCAAMLEQIHIRAFRHVWVPFWREPLNPQP